MKWYNLLNSSQEFYECACVYCLVIWEVFVCGETADHSQRNRSLGTVVLCCATLCCRIALYCTVVCCAVVCCATLCCFALCCAVQWCALLCCGVVCCTVVCCVVGISSVPLPPHCMPGPQHAMFSTLKVCCEFYIPPPPWPAPLRPLDNQGRNV